MKIVGIIIIVLLAIGAAGFFFLALKSKSGAAPGLVNGTLAPCPASPNCVSSEPGTPTSNFVTPLPISAWEKLPDAIGKAGGVIVKLEETYLAAEFSTPMMGYLDDVEFRNADNQVHVRSASRVGRSDFGTNRKRVENLRSIVTDLDEAES